MSPRSNFEAGLYEWHTFVQRGKTRGKSLKGKWQSRGKGPGAVERDEGLGTGLHSISLAGSLTTHKAGERKRRMALFFFPPLNHISTWWKDGQVGEWADHLEGVMSFIMHKVICLHFVERHSSRWSGYGSYLISFRLTLLTNTSNHVTQSTQRLLSW